VLGIDAAWTCHGPSGVALVAGGAGRWRCVAVAASYADFVARAAHGGAVWGEGGAAELAGRAPRGVAAPAGDAAALGGGGAARGSARERGEAEPGALLDAAQALASERVDVVAVDMPLARKPIVARRAADTAVSRRFGARGCSTHSPSAQRPGELGGRLRRGFEARGFELATAARSRRVGARLGSGRGRRALLEVYPHVALLALLGAERRLPYKVSRSLRYWPDADARARRRRLLSAWERIQRALAGELRDVPDLVGAAARAPTFAGLKPIEDEIDALVCAWAGVRFLEGAAYALGDAAAAIWVPEPRVEPVGAQAADRLERVRRERPARGGRPRRGLR
jgi:predicted RNase H-like nuclease